VLGAAAAENLDAGLAWGCFAGPVVMALSVLLRRKVTPLLMIILLSLLLLSWYQLH